MRRSSFLIRFIDVGLIILFGFIMISDINIRSQIRLPSGDDYSETEVKRTLIIVSIKDNGTFGVTEAETEIGYGTLRSIRDLEETLLSLQQEKRAQGVEIIAVISPDEGSIMQSLIDVLDVCDKLGIAKNINIPELQL